VNVCVFASVCSACCAQFNQNKWEPETLFAFKSCITPDTVVIDFGSWIGPTVAWAVSLGARDVYSFEPDPLAFAGMICMDQYARPKSDSQCEGFLQ
jgi:hypothetical protein